MWQNVFIFPPFLTHLSVCSSCHQWSQSFMSFCLFLELEKKKALKIPSYIYSGGTEVEWGAKGLTASFPIFNKATHRQWGGRTCREISIFGMSWLSLPIWQTSLCQVVRDSGRVKIWWQKWSKHQSSHVQVGLLVDFGQFDPSACRQFPSIVADVLNNFVQLLQNNQFWH